MAAVEQARMEAPPSTAYEVVDIANPYESLIKRLGVPGKFVGSAEVDSPWVPFGPNAAIRHLAFDVRHNAFSNILWIKEKGVIGTHFHRGTVAMLCLEGSCRYLEYDWVAKPYSLIYETPGIAHTLVTDDPNGVKLFGWLQGSIDFHDESGKLIETTDVWWFINHYESYCRENGIPINKELYI